MMTRLIPIVILVITAAFIGYLKPEQVVYIKTSDAVYDVRAQVVTTPKRQARGLMWRENLPEDRGMLFIYEKERPLKFWMKNMKISLDMLFIDSDHRIMHIEHNVPPCEEDTQCATYGPEEKVRYVLELKSGFTKKFDVAVGDEVTF